MNTSSDTTTTYPRETDEALAAVWTRIYQQRRKLDSVAMSAKHLAGAEFYYRGRQRVTDMTAEQARAQLVADAAELDAYKADHAYTEESTDLQGKPYTYHGTDWSEWNGRLPSHSADHAADLVARLDEARAELNASLAEADELEQRYTGWSRFFLVTSSKGHIHSSMHCSTCRPETIFGWLPKLSGKTEADAVAEHGPALCSVCFPTAPVEWTAEKITAARAARAAR